jgi:hypothetical protein
MTARRQHVLLCRQHVLSAGSCPRDRWRALLQAAIGTLVDLDFAAEEGVLFGYRHLLL